MRSGGTPRGFWPVWGAVALDLLGFGIVIPILPLYAERFGAGPVAIGLLFAVYSVGQAMAAPVWGRVSDRRGRRPVLLITLAGSAIGSLLLAGAGSLPVLFLGRIVDGVSGGSVSVARAFVSDVAPQGERPRLMGLLGAAFGAGFVLGPAVGGLASLAGPRVPFFLAAAVTLVNLVVAAVRLPAVAPRAAEARTRLRELGSVATRLVGLTFLAVTAFAAFETTFALLAAHRLGMGPSGIALVFAGVGTVLIATQAWLVATLAARFGELGSVRLGLVLVAGGLMVLAMASTWPELFVGLALLAVGQGSVSPSVASALAGAAPEGGAGTALGVQQSAGSLARIAGPVLGGVLFALGPAWPYLAGAGLVAATVALVPRPVLVDG